MTRVKSDIRSQLSRSRLAVCFRISEEGRPINKFKSEVAIELWYSVKVRRLGSTNHYKVHKKESYERQSTTSNIPNESQPRRRFYKLHSVS